MSGTRKVLRTILKGSIIFLCGVLVLGYPAVSRSQPGNTQSGQANEAVLQPTGEFTLDWKDAVPMVSSPRLEQLEEALRNVNLPGPLDTSGDTVVPLRSVPLPPPTGDSGGPAPSAVIPFTIYNLSDLETNNSTSVVNELSVGGYYPQLFITGNWFAARFLGVSPLTYVDPNAALPPITGQFFCCDQSVLYDRTRSMVIWISLWINSAQTTGTIRIAITENLINWAVYDLTSATFGLAGLPDYPHVALGANSLYLTINHFNPAFTQSTIARLPLTNMKRRAGFSFNYINRGEFNHKVANDYGASTKAFWATHVNNTTLRVFRWEEGSGSYQFNDVAIPAWTRGGRGAFVCTTPSGSNPCARMDDRVLSGFVTGPKKLPAGSTAQKVIGFSWNAPQDATFPVPYTNVVRIDAESMAYIDNPFIWNPGLAWIYADFYPNDRGDLGAVLHAAGAGSHPSVYYSVLNESSAVPPGWPVYLVRNGGSSPTSNTWGDYNACRRLDPFSFIWIGVGHTLQGGTTSSFVEPSVVLFGEQGDFF